MEVLRAPTHPIRSQMVRRTHDPAVDAATDRVDPVVDRP